MEESSSIFYRTTRDTSQNEASQDSQAIFANVMADIAGHRGSGSLINLPFDTARGYTAQNDVPYEAAQDVECCSPESVITSNSPKMEPFYMPDTADPYLEFTNHLSNNDSSISPDDSIKRSQNGLEVSQDAAPSRKIQERVEGIQEEALTQRIMYPDDRTYAEKSMSAQNPEDSLVADPTTYISDGHSTLQPDDTGAVNFENVNPSSQLTVDQGFKSVGGACSNNESSQNQDQSRESSPKSDPLAPVTPGPAKNPFGSNFGAAAPMGATQIFGQTQFSSAAKKFSPTSSRPSPQLLDSVSYKFAETSPLKHWTNVSSPTTAHTSSPSASRNAQEPLPKESHLTPIEEETPSILGKNWGSDVVRASSVLQVNSSNTRRPLEHYKPMSMSQEQKSLRNAAVPENEDSDEDFRRKNEEKARVAKKRARIAQEMSKVMISPLVSKSSMENVRGKRLKVSAKHGSPPSEDTPLEITIIQSSAPTITPNPSQDRTSHVRDDEHGMSLDSSSKITKRRKDATAASVALSQAQSDVQSSNNDILIVPETPAASAIQNDIPALGSEPELPRLPENINDMSSSAPSASAPPFVARRSRRLIIASSSPTLSSVTAPKSRANGRTNKVEGSSNENFKNTIKTPKAEVPKPSLLSKAKHATESANAPRQDLVPQTPVSGKPLSSASSTSSSLTPILSSQVRSGEHTPSTGVTPGSIQEAATVSSVSPAKPHTARRRRTKNHSISPKLRTQTLRASRQQYMDPDLADDQFEAREDLLTRRASMVPHATNRTSRNDLAPTDADRSLFSNMVFGISLPPEQDKQRAQIIAQIRQAGGLVLERGLEDLFELPDGLQGGNVIHDVEIQFQLKEEYQEKGFVAILADNYSRKAKYMQALVLDIPCLAYQWVSLCLAKNAIVEWEPFLLAAGSSMYLGNAVCSRHLAPYDAENCHVHKTIGARRRLLDGQTLLVVHDAKKSKVNPPHPHVFLALALGPTVTHVTTPSRARSVLGAREKAGHGFHYIYVDKDTCTLDAVFRVPDRKGKKGPWAPWSYTVRPLHDELIIQSLIIGRVPGEEDIRSIQGV